MGCNASSLLGTLEGAFGSVDQENISIASIPKAKEMVTEDTLSTPSTPSPAQSGPVGAELVFPTQAIPLVNPFYLSMGLKHSHVTDVNLLIVLKYSCKKQQPAPMSTATI